ncbi:MAG: protein kinase [Pyrinomonadaceae bacterium]
MMLLDAGTKLGRYEIRSQLGAGGMGEVYLAEDTQLKRRVALKLLPSDFVQNEDRLRRFVQEAEAAAALNHPNIAHIYEIGETDGTRFIAMEFVDGVTLNEKIHGEKAPLGKLLKYLTQVAEGLAKAHGAGIVHRDLKPDNIMIARDGYAKILDFGLAKLIEPHRPKGAESEASGETATAILAQHSTPGMIMGTVGYMSPEQAQGRVREIDHRSDIFSFGCILYEAATGRKAFEGKDTLDSLHKIVHAPVPQIKDLNADAPPDLQRIVRRCLAKEPDKRYQSIKDVAIELDELRQELKDKAALEYSVQPDSSGSERADTLQQIKIDSARQSTPDTTQAEIARSTSSAEYVVGKIKRHQRTIGVVALALLLAIGGIVFALYKFGRQDKQGAASSAQMKIERLTTNGNTKDAAISPDGKYVVYILDEGGQQSLWTRQVATSSNVQIIPSADVRYRGLVFSPDGNYINFVKQEKSDALPALYQIPFLGGIQKNLISGVYSPVSYSPNGKQFAFVRNSFPTPNESSLLIANADGTGERILASVKSPESFPTTVGQYPAWSPDGKTIACIASGAENNWKVVEVQVVDGRVLPFPVQGWNYIDRITWLPDKSGLLVLGADKVSAYYNRQIWRISYPEGEARRITTDFNNYAGMSLSADSGALAAVQSNRISNIWIAPNADASRAMQIKSGGSNLEGTDALAWTPDGRIVYYSLASGAHDIWIMNGDGSNQKQLTVDADANYSTRVTPDGRYIVFTSERGGGVNIWRMDLDGGNPKQLTSGNDDFQASVSPDSRWVIYESRSSGDLRLWKVSIDGGNAVQLTDYLSGLPRVSPDGKFIACEYREDINLPWRHAIIPFEGGKPVRVFDLPVGAENLRWSKDSRSLTYSDTRGGASNIWSFPLDGSSPKQLTNFKTEQIYNFDWSPDGKQLVLARGTTTSDVVLIKDFR